MTLPHTTVPTALVWRVVEPAWTVAPLVAALAHLAPQIKAHAPSAPACRGPLCQIPGSACKNHSLWPTWPPLLCCSHRLYSWSFTRLIGNNRRQSLLELLPSYDASWDETQTAVTETSELIKGEFDHFHALMCCWLSALGWRTFLSHCGFWNPHTGDFWLLCWNWDKTSRVNHFSI